MMYKGEKVNTMICQIVEPTVSSVDYLVNLLHYCGVSLIIDTVEKTQRSSYTVTVNHEEKIL